jgi:hypothetical protein
MSYAQNYLETLTSNEKTKQDILQRMQTDTHEIISSLSAEEYERKNKVALINDNFVRCQGHSWRKAKMAEIASGKGMWAAEATRMKMTQYMVRDGTRCLMAECYGPRRFEFYNNLELEKKIFGKEFQSR